MAQVQVQCCFTSTQTITTIRDGETRTATSTFTYSWALLKLWLKIHCIFDFFFIIVYLFVDFLYCLFNVALCPSTCSFYYAVYRGVGVSGWAGRGERASEKGGAGLVEAENYDISRLSNRTLSSWLRSCLDLHRFAVRTPSTSSAAVIMMESGSWRTGPPHNRVVFAVRTMGLGKLWLTETESDSGRQMAD